MAASSAKDKAHALKDSYVAGLIEGGATAPAPAMPTQDMGEQASVMHDAATGVYTQVNDGRPNMIAADSDRGIAHVRHVDDAANPLDTYSYKGFPKKGFMGTGGYVTDGAYAQEPMSRSTRESTKFRLNREMSRGNVQQMTPDMYRMMDPKGNKVTQSDRHYSNYQ